MRWQEDTAVTIPQTNFDPPFNITRASHLVFTARDLAASRDFYVEVLGLIVSDENADTIWLRGVEERCHHSLTLKRTLGQPQCERIGFRVFTEDDLERAKAHFDRAGIPAAFVEVPHQGRTLHFSDPAGTPVELCARMPTVPRMHTKIHTHRGAGALRMDHYQVLVRTCWARPGSTWTSASGSPTTSASKAATRWWGRSCTARTIRGTSCC